MPHLDSIRETLEKISQLALAARKGMGIAENERDGESEKLTNTIGCTARTLPKRMLIKSARTAIQINPVNGPMLTTSGADIDSDVMEPLQLALVTAKYWGPAPRRLTVSFLDAASRELKTKIITHMNAWNRSGGISFVETASGGQVRITFGPTGYWSYLGTDILHIPANRPTMNLQGFIVNTSDAEYRRVVRHEAGHTLGFPHEHMRKQLVQRIDPQKAYDYFWRTNSWNKAMVDAQVLTPLDDRTIFGTPADQDSIMCYQLPGSITKDGLPIRGGTDITATDLGFNGRVYPQQVQRTAAAEVIADGDGEWPPSEDVEVDAEAMTG